VPGNAWKTGRGSVLEAGAALTPPSGNSEQQGDEIGPLHLGSPYFKGLPQRPNVEFACSGSLYKQEPIPLHTVEPFACFGAR
jgi:hypothetical protein